jgi:uncharacterized protein
MAKEYKNPGVYIEEILKLPPSITSSETAIPAFIGYTEKAINDDGESLTLVPKRIASLLEYERYFGTAPRETSIAVIITENDGQPPAFAASIARPSAYSVYAGLQLFFANDAGPCYIVSVAEYTTPEQLELSRLKDGLKAIEETAEITLIVFADAPSLLPGDDYYGLYKEAFMQCSRAGNRFTIMDIWISPVAGNDNIKQLRDADLGTINELKYGAAYYPRLTSVFNYNYNDEDVQVTRHSAAGSSQYSLAVLAAENNTWYQQCKKEIQHLHPVQPASPAVAAIYAQVDNARGVWKAPANINIKEVIKPAIAITTEEQAFLNIDPGNGKSINCIRSFPGRGEAIVWGARTLAGNDNEWRYVSVRRFFSMVEVSVKKGTEPFVFATNDAGTWASIRTMIENYLTQQWKAGALMGSSTKEAFYVHAGLGSTMTELDIEEGRLIVEIGMAVLQPAEFIILRFMHKMLQES